MFFARLFLRRIDRVKWFLGSILPAIAIIALCHPLSIAVAANGKVEENSSAELVDIGMALETARQKPHETQMTSLKELEQSVTELMRGNLPNEKQGAAHFLLGEIRYFAGDYTGASKEYRNAAKKEKQEVYLDDAEFAYIAALEAAGRDEEAAKKWKEWDKKHGSSPLLPEALLAQAWNAMRRDTLTVVRNVLDRLSSQFPHMANDPRVTIVEATLAYVEARLSDAIRLLADNANDSQLSKNMKAAKIYLKALCYQANGDMLKAAAQYQEIVERHTDSSFQDHAMLAKADIFLTSHAFKSAAEEFTRVLQQAKLPEVVAEAELRRAASVVLDGDASRGTDLLRATVANHTGTVVGARAQYLLGELMFSQSRYEDAILEYNLVLKDYFEHSVAASAQYRVGRCLDALGRQVEATSSYQAVVSGYPLSPESPAAAYLAGVGLLAQDLPIAAAPYFQLVLDRYASENNESVFVFASPEHQELMEASLCLLELSYHQAGNLGQLSGVPHLMLQKMPPSKSSWRAYAMLIDADALASQARYDEAQVILDQLLIEFPDHAIGISANRLLAWTYAQEGQDDLAMETEAKILSRYGSLGNADNMSSPYLNKAHLLFNQKKYKEATKAYEAFLKRYPSHPEKQCALYQLGLSYLRVGHTGNAVDKWEEIVTIDPTSEIAERAWVRAGDLYFQNDHYKDAKRCYQGLLDHFSESRVAAMAMLRLAQCEYNAGNDREALGLFSAVENRFPESHVSNVAKKGIEQALFRLGQREDGSEVLSELVEQYPTSSFAADAQFEIAMRQYKAKSYNEAAESFRRVVSQFPGYAAADRAHYLMADAYNQIGSFREAKIAYEQFLMFFPDSELHTTVRFHLGSLRFRENDYMQAAIDFTSVLDEEEISQEIESASLFNLALCRSMLGQQAEAQTLLERYREEHPAGDERAADVAYQLGDIHERSGRTQLAIEEYKKALSAKSREDLATEIYFRMGGCYEQLSDDDGAITSYKKAMAAVNKSDTFRLAALVRCAALYEKAGNFTRARSAYQDLINNAKDPEIIVAAKERVSQLKTAGQ